MARYKSVSGLLDAGYENRMTAHCEAGVNTITQLAVMVLNRTFSRL